MIVIASREGRIGNSLFTFAHFLALAREMKSSVANPALGDFASELEEFHDKALVAWPSQRPRHLLNRRTVTRTARLAAALLARLPAESRIAAVKRLSWGEAQNMEDEDFLADVVSTRLLFIQGWLFYCDNFLQAHKDFVIHTLRPRRYWLERAERTLRSVRQGSDCLVGVHVRRTDYREFLGGRYYWARDDYEKILLMVSGLYGGRTKFLLTTDDPIVKEWAFPGLDVVVSQAHYMEDLSLLSGCDRLVAPPSTFSMWASFSGGIPLWFADPSQVHLREGDFRVARSHTEFPGAEEIIAGRSIQGWPWGPTDMRAV